MQFNCLQKWWVLLLPVAALGLILWFLPPVGMPLHYHAFADQRSCWGIPNFADVVSNLPFLLLGLWGLWQEWRKIRLDKSASSSQSYWLFFGAVTLVAVGSSYYHWAPNNQRLVWDMLPITVAFMALFAAQIGAWIDVRLERIFLLGCVCWGILSVGYWHYTELTGVVGAVGAGDLRPYLMTQLVPLISLVLMLIFLPCPYPAARRLWWVLLGYALAKLAEYFDHSLYALLDGSVSGHTLKHLWATWAVYQVVRMRAAMLNSSLYGRVSYSVDSSVVAATSSGGHFDQVG